MQLKSFLSLKIGDKVKLVAGGKATVVKVGCKDAHSDRPMVKLDVENPKWKCPYYFMHEIKSIYKREKHKSNKKKSTSLYRTIAGVKFKHETSNPEEFYECQVKCRREGLKYRIIKNEEFLIEVKQQTICTQNLEK